MNLLVLLKMAPDVVEELEIAPGGQGLDPDALRMALSESDDHALETALLIKERCGGTVTVLAVDAPEVDDALYTALAKGADRAVKLDTGEPEPPGTRAAADLLASVIAEGSDFPPTDLILTGTQAIDDLDGLVAPLVAHRLGWPYLGIVTEVAPEPAKKTASVVKEYSGGVRGRYEIDLPAVLGIQSAERPPRYVPVAKVRHAMKTARIETIAPLTLADGGAPRVQVLSMGKPVETGRALMIAGSPEEAAAELCGILAGRGVI
ncbi:MAG: electron transfer flavoprotein subunit beta/FixA family protein [Acidobacteria bacterium]|nr:electron transfer flavoprotein subunit beta/FixA family protein [Acidobacteriota bacterium]